MIHTNSLQFLVNSLQHMHFIYFKPTYKVQPCKYFLELFSIGTIVLMQPQQNDFNFITNPVQGNSSGPAFLQDPKKRNIIAVLFVVVVLFIIVIGFAIFASLGKKNTSPMVDVAAYQTELIRISEFGLAGTTDSSVRAQTSTMLAIITSDLTQSTSYLASSGKKLEIIDTAIHLDASIEKNLETASLRNTFDEELIATLEKTTAAYKLSLQKALDSASSEKEKKVLQTAATNILTFEGNQEKSGVSPAVAVTKL